MPAPGLRLTIFACKSRSGSFLWSGAAASSLIQQLRASLFGRFCACRPQPKEARPRPVRSRDLFGDLGQGGIARPRVLEAVFSYRDGVCPTMPFANKTRPRLQAEGRRGAN